MRACLSNLVNCIGRYRIGRYRACAGIIALWWVAGEVWAQSLTITLAGQSMIRSDLRQSAPQTLAGIRPLLQGDVIFTNLEGAIAEPGQSVAQGRGFLAPPEVLDALQSLGFNLLALSDNHAFDLGVTGIENTLRETQQRGIVCAGIGENVLQAAAPGYLHTAHGTVALVASASGLIGPTASATADRPGVNELRVHAGDQLNEATEDLPDAAANRPDAMDASRILRNIREAKHHASLVVVYQHNHVFEHHAFSTIFTEGMAERLAPADWLRRWTHAEVDAGADVVVMHGAPLLHGVEIYHGRPIFYDLGNFIYNVPPTLTYIEEPMSWESAIATIQFVDGKLVKIQLRPVVLNENGEGQPDVHSEYTDNQFLDTRGLPAPALGVRAGYILARMASLSQAYGTVMRVHGDTADIELSH